MKCKHENIRRKYNAAYRLRKQGFKINTKAKTIYTPANFEKNKPMNILINEFHYIIQTEMFKKIKNEKIYRTNLNGETFK